jgi:LCP family protein required for cell wall assembly
MRRVGRGAFWALVGLLVLAVVGAGASVGYYEYRNHQLRHEHVGGLVNEVPGQPINILVVGNNSRCVLNPAEASHFGSCSEVGGARSDVTMVVHVDPTRDFVSVLSIPRDLFVHIPGFANPAIGRVSYAKIDGALNLGPQALVETIEQDLGIPIQHYVSLDFDTFQNVVNILGGVRMYFPTPVYDKMSGLNIKQPGCQMLNGAQALALVRSRMMYYKGQDGSWDYDGNGDISRIQRVHEFLRVLASSVRPRITNPFTANALIGSVLPQLQVDQNLSLGEMAALAWHFHSYDPNKVPQYTLPSTPISSYYFEGGGFGSVVFPVQPADSQVIAEFLGLSSPLGAEVSPSSISVAVVSGTGSYSQAQQVAAALTQEGFSVVQVGSRPVNATPLETTVYYPNDATRAKAERTLLSLAGTAIMAQDAQQVVAGADVTVVVGTQSEVISEQARGNPGGQTRTTGAATSQTGSTTAGTGVAGQPHLGPSPSSSTTSTLPTGPVPPSEVYPANPPLPWYDPRACPSAPSS